jgi:hypothetical protein
MRIKIKIITVLIFILLTADYLHSQTNFMSWRTFEANPDLLKTQLDEFETYFAENYSDSMPAHEKSELKAFLRYKHFWFTRLGSYTENKLSYKPYYDAVVSFSQNPICDENDQANWELLGPFEAIEENYGPIQNSGLISELLYDPLDPERLLISSNHGGLWIFDPSEGSEGEWKNVSDNLRLPGISATEIVRHPFEHNTLFASTGNGLYSSKYGMGIIKSTNNGDSWEVMQGFPHNDAPRVPKILIDRTDNNPEDGLNMYAITHYSVWFTNNTGEDWETLPDIPGLLDFSYLYDLEMDENGSIYVTTEGRYGYSGQCFKYSNGVWNEILTDDTSLIIQRAKFTIPYDGLIFALLDVGVENSNGDIDPVRKLYKSENNGNDWIIIRESFLNPSQKMEIEYSPVTQHIYAGEIGFRGINAATGSNLSMSPRKRTNFHDDVRDIKIIGSDLNYEYLLIANDGGVTEVKIKREGNSVNPFKSLNGSYLPVNNLVGLGVGTNDFVVTGAVHGYSFKKNITEEFINILPKADGGDCLVNPVDNSIFYYQANDKMLRNNKNNKIYNGGDWFIGMPYEANKNYPNLIFFGRTGKIGIYNESNNETILKPTALVDGLRQPQNVGSIEYTNDQTLYIADFTFAHPETTHRIVKSNNLGTTWEDISQNNVEYKHYGNTITQPLRNAIGWININSIESDPIFTETIWLGIGGIATESNQPVNDKLRVVTSNNGGESWIDYSDGLSPFPVHKVIYHSNSQTLFAGTDVGVFYRQPYNEDMQQWECFSGGMPVGIVTDLEINDCGNKLFASIDGRGVWETNIPFESTSSQIEWEDDLLVSGEQEWNTIRYFDGDIILNANSTLRINSSVYFKPGSKIIVMPSAELFLDGMLSTLPNCDETISLWEGIQVIGNSNMPQLPQYQGALRTLGGAIIMNAKIGVAVYGIDNNDNYMENTSGGIIIIDNATFKSCKIGIDIRNYTYDNTNTAYKPQIVNSSFITTKKLYTYEPIETPIHIQILNNNEVSIAGCSFGALGNDLFITLPWTQIPIGVKSWYSSVNIGNCSFGNLSYGVNALDFTSELKMVDIDQNTFTDCLNGVYLNTLTNPQINRNEFYFHENTLEADKVVQIFIDQCPTFVVEENYFNMWRPDQDLTPNFGIIINNSGPANNIVYKNEFYQAIYPILALGENRDDNGLNGLSLRCNTFYGTGHGAIVGYKGYSVNENDGIVRIHGNQNSNPDDPAGNIFQPTLGEDKIKTHFWNIDEIDKIIDYYYHDADGSFARHEPGHSNQTDKIRGIIKYANLDAPWNEDESCPSNFPSGSGDIKNKLNVAAENINITSNTLNALVDAGNTAELTNDVNESETNEGFILRNQLLSASPYLSDTVLFNASEKENVLTNPLIRDVLVANPQSAKSEEVLLSLEERNNPLPDYMKQQILNGQATISGKATLEAKLHRSKAQFTNALNHLSRHYLQDTTINPVDSMIALLSDAPILESRYQLAGLYLENGNSSAMQNTFNNIVSDFTLNNSRLTELQNMTAYYNLLENVINDNRTIYQLNDNEKTELWDLRNDSVNLASALARNLLIFLGELDYTASIELPDLDNKSGLISLPVEVEAPNDEYAVLSVYPNPAADYIVCRYQIKVNYKQAQLNIIETESGRFIKTLDLEYDQDEKTIDLKGFKSGNYIISLQLDQSIVQSTSFNLIR